jgi:hypothetical protein
MLQALESRLQELQAGLYAADLLGTDQSVLLREYKLLLDLHEHYTTHGYKPLP